MMRGDGRMGTRQGIMSVDGQYLALTICYVARIIWKYKCYPVEQN